MALYGPNDLKQWALPTYWDAAYLEKYRLSDGTTYDQLLADIAAGLVLVNGQNTADPLLAGLISFTDDAALEYGVGVSNGFEDHTEYSQPNDKRGKTTGHMLPLKAYDRGLGWTWDFLRKARRVQLDEDVASALRDLKNIWAQKLLTRLFKSTYDVVGSSGRSVCLADGGTADSAYVPQPVPDRGGTFLYTHDHIVPLSGITQANLETAVGNVYEHGHDGPYELLISHADISAWTNTTNVTGYVPRPDPLLRYGNAVDLANVGPEYIGAIETDYGVCRVRATGRLPTAFWSVYKSYGPLDQRNPLVVRRSPDFGANCTLLKGEGIREFPLEHAILFTEFGAGVRDRIGAVVVKNHADTYADPTIS